MPVTKTAKRALRVSKRKEAVNKKIKSRLDAAIRKAKKEKNKKHVVEAISLADKAAKKNIIHKNKAARIKSALSKLDKDAFPNKSTKSKKSKKKSSKKKPKKSSKKKK